MWVVEGIEVVSCFICWVFNSISSICNEDSIEDIRRYKKCVARADCIYQYTYHNVSSM